MMDVKVTLSFDAAVIEKAKRFAAKNNMSLSRLTEFLYQKITAEKFSNLDEFSISDWVHQVAEGTATYSTPGRKKISLKKSFFESRK